MSSRGMVEISPPRPITGGQFTLDWDYGPDWDIVIHGRFDETGRNASGTWEVSREGTTCQKGTWESSTVRAEETEEEVAVVEVEEEEEAPKPNEWTASTGSSQFTFTFTVSPDSTGITEIYYSFFAFECAGWVMTITPSTVEKSPPYPITGGQFTIEISRSPQYGQGLDLDIVIQGSFDETGTHASGTWEISVEGTTCPAGTWEASPNS